MLKKHPRMRKETIVEGFLFNPKSSRLHGIMRDVFRWRNAASGGSDGTPFIQPDTADVASGMNSLTSCAPHSHAHSPPVAHTAHAPPVPVADVLDEVGRPFQKRRPNTLGCQSVSNITCFSGKASNE